MKPIRVRLATEQEIIAISRRNGSAGHWLVELFHRASWARSENAGFWTAIGSHLSETAATQAAKRAISKAAKRGETYELVKE